ncbi:MAG: hypothetical protein IPJ87_11670 [Flavobacteriales bacterium]|nr:hypothetical protein [Flavobacteriales bacterium]MBK7942509.1 hypothetical protein [Flavobacteriales bacterium]MBK9699090.1 hypothetical protein [Flavobacteriales bacterium]
MRHLLLASLVAMGTVAGGQGLQLPTLPIEWAEPVVWDPAWSMDTGSTAVLADTLEVRVLHVKPQFLNLFFERTRIIRFADDDGIQRHGHVQLPESLDPPMDKGERVWDPRAENPGPRWMNVRIDRVQARVLNADGTARPVEMVVHHRRWPVKNPTTVEHASSVVLDLVGIVPGDVVELRWKVMVPYDVNQPASQSWRSDPWMDNWARLTSWRIFFHDAVPVRDQQVSIRYLRKQGLTFAGEPPHIVTEEGEALTAIWHHTDLPGCMDEVNARPADDLPHIMLRLEAEDLRYWARDRISGMPVQQPPWVYVVRRRESNALWLERVARKKVPDRQNQLVKDFITTTTSGLGHAPAARRIEALHERIAMEFSYDPDTDWYADLRGTNQRMGDQVSDAVLRDISRHDLYVKLIAQHRLQHRTAYVLDRRSGHLSADHLTPVWDLEQLIGIPDDEGMLWMHPKRRRSGLLANELPFYWAGTRALLVDVTRLALDGPRVAAFTTLPVADPGNDRRRIVLTVEVAPATGSCTADLRVLLSGQFSTVGRGAWLYNGPDPAVHPGYGHRPQDAGRCAVVQHEPGALRSDPPFDLPLVQQLDLGPRLKQDGDSAWNLDLRGLLMHATPQAFEAGSRVLPFHWDFRQVDELEVTVRAPAEWRLGTDLTSGRWNSAAAALDVQTTLEGDTAVVRSILQVDGEREPGPDHRGLSALLHGAHSISDLRFTLTRERQEP